MNQPNASIPATTGRAAVRPLTAEFANASVPGLEQMVRSMSAATMSALMFHGSDQDSQSRLAATLTAGRAVQSVRLPATGVWMHRAAPALPAAAALRPGESVKVVGWWVHGPAPVAATLALAGAR